MRCGLKFSQNHNRTTSHFCGHICDAVYKMRFEWFEGGLFFKFWAFSTQPKTNFSLCFGPSFKFWSSFSLFWVGFLNQHLLGLSNFFFFWKLGCGAVRFVRFSYYKTANHTAPCGVVRCSVVQYYLWCGAVMPFCGQFWCSFCGLCGLCGLVNTPTCKCLKGGTFWRESYRGRARHNAQVC